MRKLSITLAAVIISAPCLYGQDRQHATISGFVYDASSHEVLLGANVQLRGTRIGTSTNNSGYYVLPRIAADVCTLTVNYIGFEAFEEEITLAAGEQKIVTVKLNPEDIVMDQVIVTGDEIPADKLYESDVSQLKLTGAQIAQIPQMAETDLLRSLQTLPGVLPVSDYSSALFVRGGTPDQNLYLMDGTDVYNPEHAFGLFSTFITDAVKQVDLSKGGFGAKHGGRLSSVLNVTNLAGNREEFEGTAAISLLSAKTTIQTPIGKSGSLSGSFRRTYFDKTIAPFIGSVPSYYFFTATSRPSSTSTSATSSRSAATAAPTG